MKRFLDQAEDFKYDCIDFKLIDEKLKKRRKPIKPPKPWASTSKLVTNVSLRIFYLYIYFILCFDFDVWEFELCFCALDLS